MAEIGQGYRMNALLGEGGMSRVHAGTGPAGEAVALKQMCEAQHQSRLRTEARALRELEGPGVPRFVALVEGVDGPVLVMEQLKGESLDTVLSRSRLTLGRIRAVFLEVLAVLERAHAQRWAHRDVKPANLFLCEAGETVLLDWGVARAPDQTETDSIPGTPGFVPPERLSGASGSAAAQDLYAVGASILRATTGLRVPDRGTGTHLEALLHASDLPLDWRNALLVMLHPDPARRPQTAAAARALLAPLSDQAAPTEPTSTVLDVPAPVPPTTANPPRRQSPLILAVPALLAALVLGAWLLRPAPPPYRAACAELATLLAAKQQTSGGFAGTPHEETSAWDTAQQVTALIRASERCGVDLDPAIRRGRAHLDALARQERWDAHAATFAWAAMAGSAAGERRLRALQNPDGGFAWRSDTPSHPYATVLALLSLPESDAAVQAAAAWVTASDLVRETAGLDEQAFVALHQHGLVPPGYASALGQRMRARCTDPTCGDATDGQLPAPGRDRVVLQWSPWGCMAARLLEDRDLEARCGAGLTRSDASLPSWVIAERVLALAELSPP